MKAEAVSRDWSEENRAKIRSAAEAIQVIRPGHRVFVGSGAAVPLELIRALADYAPELHHVELMHLLTLGLDPTTEARFADRVRHSNFFIGANARQAVQECRADYTPIFLSEIPALFKTGAVPVDVALVHLSPPDRHGYCSYGVSVDIVKSATEAADLVVAQINLQMPRVHGDGLIHLDEIDAVVLLDEALPELPRPEINAVNGAIGRYTASLIEDGSTLQLGIGAIPDAVLANLRDKKDLGVHTEMFSDGLLSLIETGVVNNRRKTLHRKKIVTSFVMGSRVLYDFVDDNPMIEFRPSQYTNDPFLVAQNHRMVAVNSALEVDLTGQVCADSIGHKFYSGIGGQVDFVRGAARSAEGKPVIALPSTACKGKVSRIVTRLSEGAGVVTTRGDVHYVVTEYGIAHLHGKSIRHRAIALISIAHPDFREQLLLDAKACGYLEDEQLLVTSTAHAYPIELEERFQTHTGRDLLLRPFKETDEDLLRQFFYAHSDRSSYFRFLAAANFPPRQMMQGLAHLDYDQAMAICAVDDSQARERILGAVRYFRDPRSDHAEFTVLVNESDQGQGIGTALMKKLIRVARERGVRGFTAEMLAENTRMFALLEDLGVGKTTRFERGVAVVEFSLDEVVDSAPNLDPS